MTWVGEFRPGNKTIYTVFDEESDFQVKNKQCLRPEGKSKEKRNFKNQKKYCLIGHVPESPLLGRDIGF